MREGKKKLEHFFVNLLELPRELVLDLPRATLIGNRQVVVENHRGVVEFTPERVRLATGSGEIRIEGEGLVLRNILLEEVVVEGKILALSFGA